MSENPIIISQLNDFIFCPVSIYFHGLDSVTEKITYQSEFQLNGSAAHEKSDNSQYSSRSDILQGVEVYSEQYDVFGKIDVFYSSQGKLVERKKKVKAVYDGYIFQLYAQCFALREMGEKVTSLVVYSMDDHKSYPILLPEHNPEMFARFQQLLLDIKEFSFDSFHQENPEKCKHCIYNPLCSYAITRELDL